MRSQTISTRRSAIAALHALAHGSRKAAQSLRRRPAAAARLGLGCRWRLLACRRLQSGRRGRRRDADVDDQVIEATDRGAQRRAQGQGLQGSRPHPRRADGDGHQLKDAKDPATGEIVTTVVSVTRPGAADGRAMSLPARCFSAPRRTAPRRCGKLATRAAAAEQRARSGAQAQAARSRRVLLDRGDPTAPSIAPTTQRSVQRARLWRRSLEPGHVQAARHDLPPLRQPPRADCIRSRRRPVAKTCRHWPTTRSSDATARRLGGCNVPHGRAILRSEP